MRYFTFKRVLVSLGVMLFAVPFMAQAAVFRNDVNLSQNENVTENLYITGSTPVVSGNVVGDLIACGGTVVVTGNVSNDGLIAGGNINVSGSFSGDVRIVGGNIYFDGKSAGELFVAGGSIEIGPNAVINGDLIASGGDVKVDPLAKVFGEKKIQSGEEYAQAAKGTKGFTSFIQTAFLIGQLVAILSLLLVAALLFGLLPNLVNGIVSKALEKEMILKNIGLGLLMFVVLPVAGILCLVSGIGWIVGVMLLFGFVIYLLFSMAIAGIVFGGWLYMVTKKPKKFSVKWWSLIAGVILLHIISQIPLFGWIVASFFILMSWGAVARMKWGIVRGKF
jgi:cytoskeletal protein CcmA (bactofilin family)